MESAVVAGSDNRTLSSRVARSRSGERLGGLIYGTIVALSVVVAGARSFPDEPGHIAVVVIVTCAVFWLAHVYAHGLGEGVAHEEHLSFARLRQIARREGAIVEAALPPVIALLLGAVGILGPHFALWLAFGLGLLTLGAQGLVFARVERLGPLATVAVVTTNLALGIALVALKLLLNH